MYGLVNVSSNRGYFSRIVNDFFFISCRCKSSNTYIRSYDSLRDDVKGHTKYITDFCM